MTSEVYVSLVLSFGGQFIFEQKNSGNGSDHNSMLNNYKISLNIDITISRRNNVNPRATTTYDDMKEDHDELSINDDIFSWLG